MHIRSDHVIAATLFATATHTTPPTAVWGKLSDAEKQPWLEAARFLPQLVGAGSLDRYTAAGLAKPLETGPLKGLVDSAEPATAAFLNIATTVLADVA